MNTKQQRIHEALEQSEKRYRMLFKSMQNGCALHEILCDDQGKPCDYRFLEVNPAFEELTGLRKDDVIGKRVREVLPGIEQTWIDRYGAVALTGTSAHFTDYSADLMRHYEVDVYSPQPGQFATIITDVTERCEAEEEFKLSVARFRTVLDNAADAVFVANPQGRLIYVNQKASELVGYSHAELLAKNFTDLTPPALQEKARLRFRQVFKGKSILEEASFVHRNGAHIPIDLNVVLLPDGNVYGSCRDMTSRKQAEEQIKRIEKQFQQAQKLESLGVLAGGIAHDFNNILTIILGHCYIIRDNIATGMSADEHVQLIESAANRAADLCRQMLAYAGRGQVVPSRINLRLLVQESATLLHPAMGKNITFRLDLNQDVPDITGDKNQIQQIIMNLIINAAEAIGEDEGTIDVRLSTVAFAAGHPEVDSIGRSIEAGKYGCLEVADSGCGMSEEVQKRLFEPFFTTKFTGRGLGMSAILGIVNSLDGAIQVMSLPGSGTTFRVYLPLPDKETLN